VNASKAISLSLSALIGGSLLVCAISALDNIGAYTVSEFAAGTFILTSVASAPISAILCAIEWRRSRSVVWPASLLIVSLLILAAFALVESLVGDVGN
jgi:hypothetical protein